MNGKNAWLIVMSFLFAAAASYGQSIRYLGDGSAVVSGYGPVTIALAWGEQLKPSPLYPDVIINLKESLIKYARLPVDIKPNFRLGTDDLKKLSIVLITSDSQFELSPTEIKNLKDYIGHGGTVVVDGGQPMRKMIGEIAGRGLIKPIPATHPIYRTPYEMDGPPLGNRVAYPPIRQYIDTGMIESEFYLNGVFIDDRLAVLYCDRYYTPYWNSLQSEAHMKFWVNIVTYALSQRI